MAKSFETSDFIEKFGVDDPRMGTIIKEGDKGEVVFLGFPFDEGVRRNGGRVGAAGGPDGVRPFLQRMGAIVNLEYNVDLRTLSVTDGGNIAAQSTEAANNSELEDAHSRLRQRVTSIIQSGGIPFVVGGGNDQSCPNALGLIDAIEGSVGVVNIDAHFDVRPRKLGKVHSGSPFRELMEDPKWAAHSGHFVEFAAQGSQTSAEHAKYILSKPNTRIVYLNEIRRSNAVEKFKDVLNELGEHIFVSFDLDAVSSADAPGVSAPAGVGLSAQEAVDICFTAGLDPRVRLFDLSEFNPTIEGYRTGRLVALMFYNFLLGVALRKQNAS